MLVRDGSRFTESPPLATLIGMMVALRTDEDGNPMPVTFPAISSALLASVWLDIIAVFAFCVVEKPMLSTTNARAAATITNAIITIAASIPMTPRRVRRFETEFIDGIRAMCSIIHECVCYDQTWEFLIFLDVDYPVIYQILYACNKLFI